MKNIVLLFLFAPILTFSQTSETTLPIDSVSGQIIYSDIVIVNDTVSANDLFKRAKYWFTMNFNSSKDVIQDIDKEAFTITGKALMPATAQFMGSRSWGNVKYHISIFCKDGRYKYAIQNLYHTGDIVATSSTYTSSVGSIDKANRKISFSGIKDGYREKDFISLKEQINQYMLKLIKSLKEGMLTLPPSEANDW